MNREINNPKRSNLCLKVRKELLGLDSFNPDSIIEPTSLNWPSISAGYLGISCGEQTVGSKIISEIFKNLLIDPSKEQIFPQRVQYKDFFEEVYERETPYFKKQFNQIRGLLKKLTEEIRLEITENKLNIHTDIYLVKNIMNLAIRYGISFRNWNERNSTFEILSLVESFKVNEDVSEGQAIDLSKIEQLMLTSLQDKKFNRFERLKICNRYIVNTMRYCRDKISLNDNLLTIIKDDIENLFSKREECSFSQLLSLSVVLRGVCMHPSFKVSEQELYLNRASKILSTIIATTPLESLLIKEMQYTLYLTISKFLLYSKEDTDGFLKYINKMIKLDKYDSTAWLELGLFNFKRCHYETALIEFKNCVKLGPPSLSMSHFFKGLCYKNLNKTQAMISSFEKSIEYDDTALSPVLELAIHFNNTDIKRAIKLKNQILNNNNLYEQLDPNEKLHLERIN